MKKANRNGSWFRLSTALLVAAVASGCLTKLPMAVGSKTEMIDTTKEGIVLMSVKVTNKILPAQPHVTYIMVGTKTTDDSSSNLGDVRTFVVGNPQRKNVDKSNQYEDYLVSMKISPGWYFVRGIWLRSKLAIYQGIGMAPLNSRFEVRANEITYLGHVSILRRSKKCHEFMAGPVIPIISQAALGYSTGTYDINIFDNYDRDISVFRQTYPVLKNVSVTKSVLAPWKRPSEGDPASCSDTPAGD